MNCQKVNLGKDQIGILLRLVRREKAITTLNQSVENYKLHRIELHLMKALAPAMKPFAMEKAK